VSAGGGGALVELDVVTLALAVAAGFGRGGGGAAVAGGAFVRGGGGGGGRFGCPPVSIAKLGALAAVQATSTATKVRLQRTRGAFTLNLASCKSSAGALAHLYTPAMAEYSPQPGIIVRGAPRETLRDTYHFFLRTSWTAALSVIVVVWLGINAVFAAVYLIVGGVASARAGSFWDAFCFSVQTMGTIGYGSMAPTTVAANSVMIVESVTSLIITAVATGLVFSKFSRTTGRIAFSKYATIGPMNGVPTLMIRVGNERRNSILEASIRVSLVRTERLKEGQTFYRLVDLKLMRERSQAVARSWTALHVIDETSPFHGTTPEDLAREEGELLVSIVGTDDTSLQQVHARRRYTTDEILWGARHADVLTEDKDGNLVMDIRKFHETEPTVPTDDFPYPKPAPPAPRPASKAAGA
jgi:inward rectifier potassium channel